MRYWRKNYFCEPEPKRRYWRITNSVAPPHTHTQKCLSSTHTKYRFDQAQSLKNEMLRPVLLTFLRYTSIELKHFDQKLENPSSIFKVAISFRQNTTPPKVLRCQILSLVHLQCSVYQKSMEFILTTKGFSY